tara:strand:- start:925 stop:1188 length:264 start_codon:yes stop_codon:yes gene_type:complete
MNITGIQKLAKEGKSPYFFSPDTMRFFSSKVYKDVKKIDKGYLFLTSEVFGDESRHYAVRFIDLEGSIETIEKYHSLKDAKDHLKFH